MWWLSTVFAQDPISQTSPIDIGDELWCQGAYQEASDVWKEASNSNTIAIAAQANYRLLLQASNLGWAYYGLKGDLALSECDLTDIQCALANVDREIFMSLMGLPSNTNYAADIAERLEPHIPEAATARLVYFGRKDVDALSNFEHLDGFGKCMQQSRTWDRGYGGAYYGFGLYGGGRLGVGASASWTHPNIDGHGGQLQSSIAWTTQQSGGLFLSYSTLGEKWFRINAQAQRRPYFLYETDSPSFHLIESIGGDISPGFRWNQGPSNRGMFWMGGFLRWENLTQEYRSAGPLMGLQWQMHPTLQWKIDASYSTWDYSQFRIDNELMWIHSSGLAALFSLYAAPNTEAPWWRLPTVGGGTILRTSPAHRWRDEILPSAVLEYRYKPENTIGVVAFGEIAHAQEAIHGGGGLGLRIRMPPQPYNTMRFDIGYGTDGWNVLFGAEEFFRFSRWQP